jgi:hypothetical protein
MPLRVGSQKIAFSLFAPKSRFARRFRKILSLSAIQGEKILSRRAGFIVSPFAGLITHARHFDGDKWCLTFCAFFSEWIFGVTENTHNQHVALIFRLLAVLPSHYNTEFSFSYHFQAIWSHV